jgi:hypothetical protein
MAGMALLAIVGVMGVAPLVAGAAPPAPHTTSAAPTAFSDTGGYWLVASDGGTFGYGSVTYYGSHGDSPLNKPVVAGAVTPDGHGYWMVASDGGIFNYGDAGYFGSHGGSPLNQPIVGMATTPDGGGYWLVASDGGIFAYGDATYLGSHGGSPLNRPIVGMAATPDGRGYWLVASDGGIFAYGDATYLGSQGGSPLNQPIVAMAASFDGNGYLLVASDGGVFSYGDAGYFGSHGGSPLNRPIVGITANPSGGGYWLVASDGGVFGYGNVNYYGSHGGSPLNQSIVGIVAAPLGHGYWATDGCHYLLLNGQWGSDLCVRYAQGPNGPTPNLWDFYAYPGAGQQPTQLEFQLKVTTPNFLLIRIEAPIPAYEAVFARFAWLAIPASNPTLPAQLEYCTDPPFTGTCSWYSASAIEATWSAQGTATASSNSSAVNTTVLDVGEIYNNLVLNLATTDLGPDCSDGCETFAQTGTISYPVFTDDLYPLLIAPGPTTGSTAATPSIIPATSAPATRVALPGAPDGVEGVPALVPSP